MPGEARRRKSSALRARPTLLAVHRRLSFVVAAWWALQALTGGVLVFQDQLNAWSRPELFHTTVGDKGAAAAAAAARAAVPKGRLTSVQYPAMDDGVYVGTVSLAPPGTPAPVAGPPIGPMRLVYVDPGTGRVNGVRDPDEGFVHWVTRLHDSLLQDELLGVRGRTITAGLAALTGVVVLTGLYVWYWPGKKRLRSTFRRHRRGTPLVRQRNRHRRAGIVVLPVAALLIVSGLDLQFPETGRRVWYALTPGPDKGTRAPVPPPQSVRPADGARPLSLDEAGRRAADATGGEVVAITPAFGPTGTYAVRITDGWDPIRQPRGRAGNVTVYVDQYSGRPLRDVRPAQYPVAGQAYEWWVFPLHNGSFGGFLTRVLWLLSAIGILVLVVSGLAMTYLRRRTRPKRRQALADATNLPEPYVERAEAKSDVIPIPAGTTVVRQGEPADWFYVVLQGTFDVVKDGAPVNTVAAGQSFGEIGLLTTGVRTATVTATADAELLVVSIDDLRGIVAQAERDGVDLHTASAEFAAARVSSGNGAGQPLS